MTLRSIALALTVVALSAFTMQRGAPPDLAKDPFKGVTTDGTVRPGLFTVRSSGVSTKPVIDAATAFVASLTPEQRKTTTFAVDDTEWRHWNNIHRAERAGIAFKDMSDEQRARGYGL